MWKELLKLALLVAAVAAAFYVPVDSPRLQGAMNESLQLVRDYAREHVLTCLVPAFFIAGAIAVFVRQQSVMKYLGAGANKVLAYGVASVSGSILAVCSCTVLPLFAGIYRMGAGLGPASAFLYSGPAINVLAIVLSARVLGIEIGAARAVGAVSFGILIGLAMHLIYRREEVARADAAPMSDDPSARPLWKTALFFATLVGILVFANWGRSESSSITYHIWRIKWILTSGFALALGVILGAWFRVSWRKLLAALVATAAVAVALGPLAAFVAATIAFILMLATGPDDARKWLDSTWTFAKLITPLLLIGVLVAGFLLGRPGHEGLIPSRWIEMLLGAQPDAFINQTHLTGFAARMLALGWPLVTNLFASFAGALMYFATLTEVPIVQGLLGSGMGKGPALALLLAGPALSLPSMLVIRSVLGTRKTLTYIALVVIMATASGLVYGGMF